ncbi:M23 family metallopeptidase [Polymorphobacter sp. PAMC 29334]|uniref:M23 family metallopeptidase n=1 Tax=Polymorphobacter sp. PAMC 29334 TaxID=2862331 RepID=UPI001C67643A|nr:M23 family metallopeptidase [Polymorphobacter sp. PAMC 29334]QYE36076.1 M23 family metallopeptidase [Polymorphobacter sp. PAMC 29334]
MKLAAAAVVLLVAVSAAPTPAPREWQIAGRLEQGGIVLGTAPLGTTSVTVDGAAVRLTGDRRFIAGFGRDAAPTTTIVAHFADGTTSLRTVPVAKRTWQIESIPSLRQPPPDAPPDPVYDARRAVELAEISAARAGDSDDSGWEQAFAWPAHGRISGVYGSQRILGGVPKSPHLGLDVAAPPGTPVLAPADGTVRLAHGPFLLEGNLVMLDHGHGLVSAFLHLSWIDVKEGQHVVRGEELGRVGMTGRATGPHLHWALSWRTARLDPGLFVPEGGNL